MTLVQLVLVSSSAAVTVSERTKLSYAIPTTTNLEEVEVKLMHIVLSPGSCDCEQPVVWHVTRQERRT